MVKKEMLDRLANQFNIKNNEDWYNVTPTAIVNEIGNTLLKIYGYNLYNMLSDIYPEYEWLPWKFVKAPGNFWKDIKNQRKFFDWVGKTLGVSNFDGWYSVK